ncbi:MAG TPA: hypothetical protein VNY09_00335 [Candidatus Sulfotelmatobacter sp.]|jgi:hypothetical protein|nr:hypothetical protein [Candidatus Sulfotelmatobacter sp.]
MRKKMWRSFAMAIFLPLVVLPVRAQQRSGDPQKPPLPEAPQPTGNAAPAAQTKTDVAPQLTVPPAPGVHRFWDRENDWLFAAVGAGRALDYASTLNIRRRGIDEAFLTNAIVDNHPLFAGIEAAATGASIGVSYVFHRTGHHRLEHWTSIIHFGIATGGAIRNYSLKTPHPG